jgi:hypothetical protein
MSRSYAEELKNDALADAFTQFESSLSHRPVTSMASGLAGGALSLVDVVAFGLLPEVAAAKWGMGASAASRSGTGLAAVASKTVNGAINAEAGTIVALPVQAAIANYNQTEFGVEQVVDTLLLAPVIGGAAGFLRGSVHRLANKDTDRHLANAAMHAAASGKDPAVLHNLLVHDPRVAEQFDAHIAARDAALANDDNITAMAGESPPDDITAMAGDYQARLDAANALARTDEAARWNALSAEEKAQETAQKALKDNLAKERADEALRWNQLSNEAKIREAAQAAEALAKEAGGGMHTITTSTSSPRAERLAAQALRRERLRKGTVETDQTVHGDGTTPPKSELSPKARERMTTEQVDTYLKQRRLEEQGPTKRLVDEVLAAAERDPVGEKRIRSAQTVDERFLNDAWKKLFGVDLRFVDPKFSDRIGMHGFIKGGDPSKAYIRAGKFNDGTINSMLFLAGHELGHSVRMRDPGMWVDMTNAMMKTATDKNGPLAQAWTDTVHARSGSVAWAGLGMLGKQDEAFASVLGQAMQNGDFWREFRAASPASANKLTAWIVGLNDKVTALADKKMSPSIKGLYEGLSTALHAADGDGRLLAQKSERVPGSGNLSALYQPIEGRVKRFQSMMSDTLNRHGTIAERELGAFIEWQNEVFPRVATLDDKSSSNKYSAVYKGVRIDSGNPAIWLMGAVFKRAPEGSLEHSVWKKFGDYVWDPKQDKRTAKGGKDYYSTALREYYAAQYKDGQNKTPLISFKKNTDGTWDIGFHNNDSHPRWHEVFDNLKPQEDQMAKVFVQDSMSDLLVPFHNYLKYKHPTDRAALMQSDFGRYLDSLSFSEIRELVAKDPTALWQGFGDFLTEMTNTKHATRKPKNETAVIRSKSPSEDNPSGFWDTRELDPKVNRDAQGRMTEYHDLFDPLVKPTDPVYMSPDRLGKQGASDAEYTKALSDAWDDVRKNFPEVEKAIHEERTRDTAHEASSLKPEEFLNEFHAGIVAQVRAEFADTIRDMENMRRMQEGEPLLLGNDPKADAAMMAEFAIRGNNQKWEAKNARMEEAILAEADSRMAAVYPNWGLQESALKAAKAAEGETISVADAARSTINDEFSDHPEFAEQPKTTRFKNFDGLNADDYTAMAAEAPGVESVVNRLKLSAKQAAAAVFERLKREHAAHAPFLLSGEQAQAANVTKLAERAGFPEFKLEMPDKVVEGKKTAMTVAEVVDGPLAIYLEGIVGRLKYELNQLDRVSKGHVLADDFRAQELAARVDYHTRHGLTKAEAIDAAKSDVRAKANSEAVAAFNNDWAGKNLLTRGKAGLNTLFSYLDGSPRELFDRSFFDWGNKAKKKVVQAPGDSVAERMNARVTSDTAPLMQVLTETGLYDLWRNNDEVLMRAYVDGMKKGKSPDPKIQRLIETSKLTNEAQAGRLNSFGANIRYLPGFFASQFHNPHAMRMVEKPEFIRDMMKWVDWKETEKNIGHNAVTDGGMSYFDPHVYLDQFYHEATDLGVKSLEAFDPATAGGNIASQVSRSRTIYFDGTFAFDHDRKYGSGALSNQIFQQITKRAELGTVMEHLGSDYKKVTSQLMRDLGHAGNWRMDKLGRIDWTLKELTGDLNHPEEATLAAKGQAIRQYQNIVALPLAGISSLTDIPMSISTMLWMGVNPKDLHSRVVSAMSEYAARGPQERAFLTSQGAGLEAMLRGASQTQLLSGPVYRMAAKGSDAIFKLNGQEFITNSLQYAFHDIVTQHLGDMAKSKTLTPEFKNWLAHYGITDNEWARMAKHSADIDGLPGHRLAADLVTDLAISDKLRTAISDSVHQAILQPSVSDRAALTLGMKAGTHFGEAARIMGQYKAYPLAMLTRTHRRFGNAYGEGSKTYLGVSVADGRMEQLAWAGSMLAMASTVLAIKDVLRGREPLNPFDTDQYTIGNMARIVAQAGIGPTAVVEQFMQNLAGPAFGTAIDIGQGMASGNGYKVTNAVMGQVPGLSVGPIREASKALLGSIFSDTYGVNYQMYLRNLRDKDGQTSIYLANGR